MATKWKYATIPANMRLDLLKQGNKELYDEEIARTKDVIASRLDAGLDVDEQMKWADTVSYNYNLSNASNMGISKENVNKDGYAQKLFGDLVVSDNTGKASTVKKSTRLEQNDAPGTDLSNPEELYRTVQRQYNKSINSLLSSLTASYNEQARSIREDYKRKKDRFIDEFAKQYDVAKEALLSQGYSFDTGKGLTESMRLKDTFVSLIAELDRQESDAIGKAYSSLQDKINSIKATEGQDLANEYYRYSQLVAQNQKLDADKAEYATENEKWWAQFTKELSSDEKDRALEQQKLDQNKSAADAEYEKWLKEFEEEIRRYNADNEYRYSKLSSDNAYRSSQLENDRYFDYLDFLNSYQKNQNDYDVDLKKLELSESEKSKTDAQDEEYYDSCLEQARRAHNAVVYDSKTKTFVRKYSDNYVNSLIEGYFLTKEQKDKMRKELNLVIK